MLYQFKCRTCDHEQEELFPASEYDKRIAEDGRLKRKRCENCSTISLYRHIINMPGVMGGTKGYISMERWQQKHPEHYKQKEEALQRRLDARREKRLNRLNKQTPGGKRDQRHEGYGKGYGEERLRNDDK